MKKRIIALSLAVITLFGSTESLFAWGKQGHQMVAEVTFSYLDAATKTKVLAALKNYTIEQAATWMDDMRTNPQLQYLKSWHFVNMDKGKPYAPTTTDAVYQLNKAITALTLHRATLPPDTVQRDLFILFHLMGDLHQPLHVGYGSDYGGNKISVSAPGNTQDNLHHVWDDDVIANEKITPAMCIQMNKAYTPAQIKAIDQVNVMTWLGQSRAYLTTNIYSFSGGTVGQGSTITQAYLDQAAPVVEKQIGIAGLRLAAVLTAAFKN
ncbi:S1/P1 nuclease [uncultured Mucilaginibacter sp.]|uniref:S1/P1 nuclease n=1 Tax=uncultured Mucilaginibacter sp. TaxID=797541 RepID=UPI0025E2BE5B|nr:S1/P1 nuclease [uncultured Mucilaginibacter sp.]